MCPKQDGIEQITEIYVFVNNAHVGVYTLHKHVAHGLLQFAKYCFSMWYKYNG